MTKLRHHPSDETLMSLAAGALDPAFALVLSCHLQFCDACRSEVRAMEELGGLLLEEIVAEPAGDAFFERTMRRFAAESVSHAGSVNVGALDPGSDVLMPAPLAKMTGLRRETIPWKIVAPGLRQFDLAAHPGSRASTHIVNIEAGAILPRASYGSQIILVLWGGYDYGSSRVERGDLHEIAPGSFESFKAESREGATFLTAIDIAPQYEILRTAH